MEIIGDALVEGSGTVATLTANSFAYVGAGGLLSATSAPTNGQLLIGSTGGAPVAAALTAGTGITITNGAGTITIAASGGTGVTSLAGTANQITASAATGAVTLSLANNAILPGTASVTVPVGTTAQRPGSPTTGMYRFNTDLNFPETYFWGAWNPDIGGSNGGNTVFDDFQTEVGVATAFGALTWTAVSSGTGAAVTNVTTGVDATNQAIGTIQLSTGTTAAGRTGMSRGNTSVLFGYAYHTMEWRIWTPTLNDGVNIFTITIGFTDNYGVATDVANGAYFLYDPTGVLGTASANWQICTASGSTRSKTTSGTAVSATGFVKLGIEVNAAGTLVTYYVNGTSIGTQTTNIPTATAFGTGAKILKSAGTVARTIIIDYFKYTYVFTTPR
jgi:hypothetical protein